MAAVKRFRPLLDRVLVQRLSPETKTKSGLVIPEKAQEKVNEAKVVAVGAGGRNKGGEVVPVSVTIGDTVLVPEYGGTKLKFDDEDYVLLRDGDILGTFNS
ncbi:10 kDa heat shock protein, mitochondrial [Geodia barretti]|uniref:10 kDa heat shock protein, mitochondrial n=1 Tax=Geodia barretti TaxID=519541 RepID=A0AA35WA97_GEOBA|nr:10 kDa heat shock protein, mitochondrial [Geodia barretti]